MFFPEGRIRVFVYGHPVSMRLSYDGLYALVCHHVQRDPLSGDLYGFINRRANQIKVLYFDRSGWCLRRSEPADDMPPARRRSLRLPDGCAPACGAASRIPGRTAHATRLEDSVRQQSIALQITRDRQPRSRQ